MTTNCTFARLRSSTASAFGDLISFGAGRVSFLMQRPWNWATPVSSIEIDPLDFVLLDSPVSRNLF